MLRNAAIVLGAFLLGLLPPLFRTVQLNQELAETRARLELAEARDLAAAAYVEVNKNNFGVASKYASELFARLEQITTAGEQPASSRATETLQKRDEVMGLLSTADPRAKTEFQGVVEQLLSPELESTARARRR